VGDFIQLETGETGHVLEIGWRTTRIRKLDNNVVIIPNNKLAQNRIINYDMLESGMSAGLSCGVSYDSDWTRSKGFPGSGQGCHEGARRHS